MVACLQLAHHASRDRGHAGGGGARILRPFKRHHALFKSAHGRIAEARINIAVFFFLKACFRLLGAVINIARGEIKRFRRLAKGRAFLSFMHHARLRLPVFCVGHDLLLRDPSCAGIKKPTIGPGCSGSFSCLFNEAASQPAQITSIGQNMSKNLRYVKILRQDMMMICA